jgi:hypothetical protein
MTDTRKKTFLLRDAPYNFKEFKSFEIRYGTRNNMVNYYNSATGERDYLNKKDSLIKTSLQLTVADLDSLHKNASNLGFFDFPEQELNNDTTNPGFDKAPRYVIQFNYKRKSKQVTFDANYNGPARLVDANKGLITKIKDILSNAEERGNK